MQANIPNEDHRETNTYNNNNNNDDDDNYKMLLILLLPLSTFV